MLTLIYTTFETHQDAMQMAKNLLEKRLIACANINPPHTSLYHWKGTTCEGQEVSALFKTTAAMSEEVKGYVEQTHPYDCPCIVVLEADDASRSFLSWAEEQVNPDV